LEFGASVGFIQKEIIYVFRTVFEDNNNSVQQNINISVFILATQFSLYEEEIKVHINVT